MPVVDPLMPTRRATLDMLRGVAILLVIGRHFPSHTLENPIIATWFRLGWTGVDLFFVLSGFLVGGILFAEHRETDGIGTAGFFIRRAFKILPPYFAFLIFGAMLITSEHSGTIAQRAAFAF